MTDPRFELVFEKLAEAQAQDAGESSIIVKYSDLPVDELREIDELRRFSMEVAEPRPLLFTRG